MWGCCSRAASRISRWNRSGPSVGGQLRVEHLERHRPVVLEIPSEIHRRHAAAAELALDHVAVCQCGGELALEIGHQVPATSFWNRGFFRSGS